MKKIVVDLVLHYSEFRTIDVSHSRVKIKILHNLVFFIRIKKNVKQFYKSLITYMMS